MMKHSPCWGGVTAMIFLGSIMAACAPSSGPDGAAEKHVAVLAEQIEASSQRLLTHVKHLADFTAGLYQKKDEILPHVDRSRYGFHENGSFYKLRDDGGAALWISGAVPITEEVQEVAFLTEPMDSELIRLTREVPEVTQAYYNDRNSLNRIYPWFDVIAQYPPRMNIPDYNFYYLADAKHNPGRGPVWVDEPYVDPAGRGWMISAIAPVYHQDELMGVVGLDVTISRFVEQFLGQPDEAVAVVAQNGVLVAATEKAISLLEMPPLKDHKYLETVKQDTYKPDEYNLRKSRLSAVRQVAEELLSSSAPSAVTLQLPAGTFRVYAAPVAGLNWRILEFVRK